LAVDDSIVTDGDTTDGDAGQESLRQNMIRIGSAVDQIAADLREQRALLDGKRLGGDRTGSSFSALLIGQATAVIALAVAVIYAAGDLDLGLKIWFIKDTWAPVLSGMPQDLVLVAAISDAIPAFIVSIPVYLLYRKLHGPDPGDHYQPLKQIIAVVLSAAAGAAVTLLFLLYTEHFFAKDVLRPWLMIVTVCFGINVIVMGIASSALWLIDKESSRQGLLRHFLCLGVVAIALLPCVAADYAAFPLPKVVLCGQGFYYSDQQGRRYMVGNLIGNSGQWAYVAETRIDDNEATGSYVAVVPLSSVADETIGGPAECHNLAPVSGKPSS
jgi:hypothetical protein